MSLSLPTQNTIFVFVLSILMVPRDGNKVIAHLVRKTSIISVVDFCLINGEKYSEVQEKIERMICKEMNYANINCFAGVEDGAGGL